MHQVKIPIIITVIFFHLAAWCENKVVIYITNNSNETLEYTHTKSKGGNKITIDPPVIRPGSQAIITGFAQIDTDLEAILYFKNDAHFTISDRRQKHFGTAIFALKSPFIVSHLISKTPNPLRAGDLLMWVEAEVDLRDKSSL
jgi:hypothetical protein